MAGYLDPMFNISASSSFLSQTAAPANSPSSSFISNLPPANGQPAFAQVVDDAVNRSPSGPEQGQSASSNSNGPAATMPALDSLFFRNSEHEKKTNSSKQGGQAQSQSAFIDMPISQAFLPPGGSASLQAAGDGTITVGPSSAAGDSHTAGLAPTTSAQKDQQISQSIADGAGSILFISRIKASLRAPEGLPSPATLSETTSTASSPNTTDPAKPTVAASPSPTVGAAANSVALDSSAAAQFSTAVARALASQDASPATPAISRTAMPASSPSAPQQGNAALQVVVSSPSIQQGQRLSTILQHVATLQDPGVPPSPVSSINVYLAQTAEKSQLAQIAEKTSLAASAVPHSLQPLPAIASTAASAAQPSDLKTNSVAVQNPASAVNHHTAGQDSSANQGGQGASSSSTPSDSSVAPPALSKNQSADFPDALSALSAPKAAPSQAGQVPGAPAQLIATQPQPITPATQPAQEPLPPPSAQSQSPLPNLHNAAVPWGHSVSDAQLTNAAGQSEMRIALQTDKLGAIELHTRVSGDQVGAAIIVEKRDAHAALAVELPALQQALSDRQLRVDQVALTQGSLGSTTGDAGANAQQNQRGMAQPPPSTPFWNETRSLTTAAWFVPEQIGIFNSHGRLSVQA